MKPILFSTPMVRALLNTKPGTWPAEPIDPSKLCKSQTRRVVKPQPEYNFLHEEPIDGEWFWTEKDTDDDMMGWWPSYDKGMLPRYQAGDILWVRETFYDGDMQGKMIYRADGKYDCDGMWKPSIHMPRYVARLFLEVKAVRVERLQDITEADARAEGESPTYKKLGYKECSYEREKKCHFACNCFNARENFAGLWDAINGKGAWASNPWVWVYEFMRVEE